MGGQVSQLKTDFTSALSDAVASGKSGDEALQAAIDKMAADNNTTADSILSRLGETKQDLTDQFSTQLSGVQSGLETKIGDVSNEVSKLGQTTQAQYDALSDAQKEQVAALAQQGQDLTSAISGVSGQVDQLKTDFTSALSEAVASGKSGDEALQAAIDKMAADNNTTADNILSQLGETKQDLTDQFTSQLSGVQSGLETKIGDLSQQTQAQYEALSDAQKQQVADLAQQGQDLTTAINNVQSGLETKIGDVSDEVSKLGQTTQAQYDALSDAQKEQVAALAQQGQDLTSAISGVSGQVDQLKTDLTSALSDAIASGKSGDEALQEAIDRLAADNSTTADNILNQLGETKQDLTDQFTSQLGGVQEKVADLSQDMQDKYASLDDSQKALADKLEAQGVSLTDAINQAEAETKGEFTTQLGGVQDKLTSAIEDAKAQGLAGDDALQAAINTVSYDLGTTKEDLLSQMGTTEANLRDQFTEQIGASQQEVLRQLGEQGAGFTTQLGDVKSQLGDAIDAAVASGKAGDDALQAALDEMSTQQGVDKQELLDQLGTTEADLRNEFTDKIGASTEEVLKQLEEQGTGLQEQFTTGLGNVQDQLSSAIEDAKAQGLAGDEALQAGLNTLSYDLGANRQELLDALGTTEES